MPPATPFPRLPIFTSTPIEKIVWGEQVPAPVVAAISPTGKYQEAGEASREQQTLKQATNQANAVHMVHRNVDASQKGAILHSVRSETETNACERHIDRLASQAWQIKQEDPLWAAILELVTDHDAEFCARAVLSDIHHLREVGQRDKAKWDEAQVKDEEIRVFFQEVEDEIDNIIEAIRDGTRRPAATAIGKKKGPAWEDWKDKEVARFEAMRSKYRYLLDTMRIPPLRSRPVYIMSDEAVYLAMDQDARYRLFASDKFVGDWGNVFFKEAWGTVEIGKTITVSKDYFTTMIARYCDDAFRLIIAPILQKQAATGYISPEPLSHSEEEFEFRAQDFNTWYNKKCEHNGEPGKKVTSLAVVKVRANTKGSDQVPARDKEARNRREYKPGN